MEYGKWRDGLPCVKDEWIPEIGETLSTRREPENMEDKYVCVWGGGGGGEVLYSCHVLLAAK